MCLELNGDFHWTYSRFMHRTKHLTKPRLGERLGGVAPNQDTKKQPISNQEGSWTQWPKAVMARVEL